MRVVVRPGQLLKPGDVIAECQSSSNNEMSLGVNLTAAFVCWRGLNFEDSIVVSEDVAAKGLLQSFHMLELSVKVCETDNGNELLTKQLPLVGREQSGHLQNNGLVSVGAFVRRNDILIGKVTPKNPCQLDNSEEGKGIDAELYIDSSLRVPPNVECATVVDVSLIDDKTSINKQPKYAEVNECFGYNSAIQSKQKELFNEI